MHPLVRPLARPAVVAIVLAIAVAPAVSRPTQPPAHRTGNPVGVPRPPAVPPGALRIVKVARHKGRAAICAEEPGTAVERAGRSIPRTRVWVRDGTTTGQLALGPGACDPAWSPDGDRLAVVTPDGLWVMSADLRRTTHLVDVHDTNQIRGSFDHRTLGGPGWAPDASALAFVASNGRTSWVEVVDARTGALRYASDMETDEFEWGADSRSLRLGTRVVRLP